MRNQGKVIGDWLADVRASFCVTALVVLAAALWGCSGEPELMDPPARTPGPPDLEAVLDRIGTNASKWRTLDAECNVTISSAYLRGQGGQITRRGGRLRILKPGKIMLRVPEKGELAIGMVGDGERYTLNMPVFGESYSARYGSPLPVDQLRITFMPDDLVDALDYTNLFGPRRKVPVIRQMGGLYVIDCLRMVTEPKADLYVDSSLTFEPNSNNVMMYRKYQPDGSLRAEIRYPGWDLYQAAPGEDDRQAAARLPGRLWLAYPPSRTLIMITLEDVTLNEELDPAQFELEE
ncbi:MAG: hypothetical protein R6X33_15515 [Candidatus Brocadiia bacterium]